MSVWAGHTHASFSLRCSWPEGSPSGGFDRGCLDSGFSELVSLEYDREASLSSFLRSHPCIQVSHLYLVPLCQHYLGTHSNVLSMDSPTLFYTLLFAHLTRPSHADNAKPKSISLSSIYHSIYHICHLYYLHTILRRSRTCWSFPSPTFPRGRIGASSLKLAIRPHPSLPL